MAVFMLDLGYTTDTIKVVKAISTLNNSYKSCVLIMLTKKKDALHLRKPNTAHEYRRMVYAYFKLRNAP